MGNENFDIAKSLGRIEGQLTGVVKHLENLNNKTEKNSIRISKVETKMAYNKGKASAVGAGSGAIVVVFWEIIKAKIGIK